MVSIFNDIMCMCSALLRQYTKGKFLNEMKTKFVKKTSKHYEIQSGLSCNFETKYSSAQPGLFKAFSVLHLGR